MKKVKGVIVLLLLFFSVKGLSQEISKLLEEGIRLYQEDLDFEAAINVFEKVVNSNNSLPDEKLEALEYIAASYYALNKIEKSKEVLKRIVEINPNYTLKGETHPPELHEMLESIRSTYKNELKVKEEEEKKKEELTKKSELEVVVYEEEEAKEKWYKKWWFWTIVGVVVIGGVTTGVVLGVSSTGGDEPPKGNVSPYIVKLPEQ